MSATTTKILSAKELKNAYEKIFEQYEYKWSEALKETDEGKRKAITDFRKNIVQNLVKLTQIKADDNFDELKGKIKELKAGSAGSDSFSSDIDVNLKGTGTEYAVKIINDIFREISGRKEMGNVMDINFYAKDFVPSYDDVKSDKGGDKWRTFKFKDSKIIAEDVKFQDKMALVFMKKNMGKKFGNYETSFKKYIAHGKDIIKAVNDEYKAYSEELEKSKGGSQIAKENLAYERKLKVVAKKRLAYEGNKKEDSLLEWKKAITYSTLYANEAHCTAGAIIDTVANRQMLDTTFKSEPADKSEPAKYKRLKLTKYELFHSFSEQVGFIFHRLPYLLKGDSRIKDSEKLYKERYNNFVKLGKYVDRAFCTLDYLRDVAGWKDISGYTDKMRKAAEEWGGLKKGMKKDNGKYVDIKKGEEKKEMERILKNLVNGVKDTSLADGLVQLKIAVDQKYFGIKK